MAAFHPKLTSRADVAAFWRRWEYGRVVPRFYFNLCNGAEFTEDEEGTYMPDLAAAQGKAVDGLRGVMAGDLLMGDLNIASFVEIEDEQRELIQTVTFADVVQLRDEPPLRRR